MESDDCDGGDSDMTTAQLKQYIKDNAEEYSNGDPCYTYTEMLVYNDLKDEGKIGTGLNSVITVYEKLFGFGLSLSGYQFIGLVLEKSCF